MARAAAKAAVVRVAAREVAEMEEVMAVVAMAAARVAVGRAAVAVAGAREDAWADTGAELAGGARRPKPS